MHGWGVFALEPINKNRRIIEYAGEKIATAECYRREATQLEAGTIWCFEINHKWAIDGSVGGNDARFFNHACAPNCYSTIIGHTVLFCAARRVETGEELTIHYHSDGAAELPCRCRPQCSYVL